ncbi:MAG TPA: glutaredoxin family protein [Pseudomonadota bacterium]|nr:glutaredoxin family protein [Pseudomonadota bacterium]
MVAMVVELSTRRGCHLCDDAKAALGGLRASRPFALLQTDVDSDPALQAACGLRGPVVFAAAKLVSELRFDAAARAALDRCLEGAP